MNGNHPLYSAAVAADDAFQVELVRVYGLKAGDMRYQPTRWPNDPRLFAAAERKHAADAVWMQAMRGAT